MSADTLHTHEEEQVVGLESDFEQVKNEAWRQSFGSLIQWQRNLEQGLAKKSEAVNAHLHDMAVLYGKEIPEKLQLI